MRKWITPFGIIAIALLIVPLSDAQASSLPTLMENGVVVFPIFAICWQFGATHGDEIYEARFDLNGDGVMIFRTL